jgi:3-oxoacyl-[acyl-carrier protein] reductase
MSLEGQIALVTGASRGIGRAIALKLGRLGAYVIVNYRDNEPAAKETLSFVADQGRGELARFDVSDDQTVELAVKKIIDHHDKIDILVNNAGLTSDSLLIRMKTEDWEQVVGTNLKGTAFCTKAVSRSMIRQRYGRIINVSSVVAQMGNAGQATYAASKAGVIGFTKAMARELAPRGITVNAVAPGLIETEMTAHLSVKLKEEFLHSIPLGRYGTCEEVAESVAFLAGTGAAYITGQVLSVNGGLYM